MGSRAREGRVASGRCCGAAWVPDVGGNEGGAEQVLFATVGRSSARCRRGPLRGSGESRTMARSRSSGLSSGPCAFAQYVKSGGSHAAASLPDNMPQSPPGEAKRCSHSGLWDSVRMRVSSRKLAKGSPNSCGQQDTALKPRASAGSTSSSGVETMCSQISEGNTYYAYGESQLSRSARTSGMLPWAESEDSQPANGSEAAKPPKYKRLTIDERCRMIEEERERRLEKVRQDFAVLRASVVAPRPHTLTRVRMGNFKAIGFYGSRRSYGGASLLSLNDTPVVDPRGVSCERKSMGSCSGSFRREPASLRSEHLDEGKGYQCLDEQRCVGDDDSSESALSIDRDD